MNALCVLLLTLWLVSIIRDFTLGGLVHLLALAAVLIVLMTDRHGHRRAWRSHRLH
jgi:hypothetical protein